MGDQHRLCGPLAGDPGSDVIPDLPGLLLPTWLCPSASSGEPAEEKTGVRLGKIALVTQPLRLLVNKKRLLRGD